eukprot:6489252-Amphidinium_carterae.2
MEEHKQRDDIEALRDTALTLWKRQGGLRWRMQGGDPLDDTLIRALADLGFVDAVTVDFRKVSVKYVLLGGASLLAMHQNRFKYLNKLLQDSNEESAGHLQLVVLAGNRPADMEPGSSDHPALLEPDLEGHPVDICVATDDTEATLAAQLCKYYAELPGQPDWIAAMWRSAYIADSDGIEKPNFHSLLSKWVAQTQEPGGVLCMIEQPHLPRYRVQLTKKLHAGALKGQPVLVAGPALKQRSRGNVILDAVAHWMLACREASG